jgi:hypothetical protein
MRIDLPLYSIKHDDKNLFGKGSIPPVPINVTSIIIAPYIRK